MSFLTPLFLLGGLAIAGPILFHLIRRNTRERFTFSSLMFLSPEPPKVTRKSRLEDILLLLARCALLALLALAFARPFFQRESFAAVNASDLRRTVILIDASASMQRDGLWEKAKAKALARLDETKPSESLAILAFGDKVKPLLSFEQWNDAPMANRHALGLEIINDADLKPGWEGTHLGNAILTAAEWLDEIEVAAPKRIIVLTDRQEGSRLDGLQGHEWPKDVEVVIETVLPDSMGNAGLHLAPESESEDNATRRLRMRVSNSKDATKEKFQLAWVKTSDANATGGNPVSLYLPAGRTKTVNAPPRPIGGDWQLRLLGDEESFDDQVFLVPESPDVARIHYVGKEKSDEVEGMRFFLQRAFSETRLQKVELLAHSSGEVKGKLNHPDDRMLIVTENLAGASLAEARAFCESGHPVLLVLKDNELGATLSALAASGPVPVTEAKVKEYALLAEMDFEHPLLAPFNDPRYSDFTKIHFWKHRVLDAGRIPGARVLGRFDDGSPALLDLPLGRGNLLVLTSGWHPDDSELARSSKFVPLLYSIMAMGRSTEPVKAANLMGRPISLPAAGETDTKVTGPSGEVELSETGGFFHAEEPGLYTLETPASSTSFAVNLQPTESRTSLLPEERIAGLNLPLGPPSEEASIEDSESMQILMAEELENEQKTWRWFIMGAILLAILETWLGGRTWRRPAAVSETGEAT